MAHIATQRRGHKRSLPIVLGAVTALAALSTPFVLEASAGAATSPDTTLSSSDIPKRDAPALDLVVAAAKGTVTLYQAQLSTAAVRYVQSDPTFGQRMRTDPAGAIDSLLDQMAQSTKDFMVKGASLGNVTEEMSGTGSGWNVTSDGVLVTNAHVVDMTTDLVATAVDRDASAAVARVVDNVSSQLGGARYGLNLSSAQRNVLGQIVSNFMATSANVSNYATSITVYPDHSKGTSFQAKVLQTGEAFPRKDVAILKVNASNLPVIGLDDDTKTATGDTVFALGYPYDATFDTSLIKTTTISATLSKGLVSNRLQSSAADYKYIEHTASINHGSSGGVLVSERGRAIGITTAIDTSLQNHGAGNGGQFFYAVPVSVVKEFLSKAGVTPSMSPDQQLFDQAVGLIKTDAPAQDLAKARDLLSRAKANGYTTPHLDELLQQLPGTSVDTTPDTRPVQDTPVSDGLAQSVAKHHGLGVWPVVGGMLTVLTLAVLALVFVRRRGMPPASPATPPSTAANPPWWAAAPMPPAPPGPPAAATTPPPAQQPWMPPPAPAWQSQPAPQPWFQPQPTPTGTVAPAGSAPSTTPQNAAPVAPAPSGWWTPVGHHGNAQ